MPIIRLLGQTVPIRQTRLLQKLHKCDGRGHPRIKAFKAEENAENEREGRISAALLSVCGELIQDRVLDMWSSGLLAWLLCEP